MSIRNELIQLMERKGLSQLQVGKAIGKSTAVVNQFLQGKYLGNVVAVEEDVRKWIKRQNDKERSHIDIQFIETPTARKGLELIKLAHEGGDINVLYGEAGLGKTMILKAYTAQNSNVLLIEADPGYTAKVLLEELCNQLNVTARGNLHELIEACVMKLRQSGRLIIIDEAELLPYRALEVLRRIHDRTGVGIVLAGMPRLIINLKGRRGELVQLYSRVAFALNLGNALSKNDLDTIALSVIDDVDESTRNAFYAASKGNARRLSKLLKGAVRLSRINDIPVNASTVQQFSQMLIN